VTGDVEDIMAIRPKEIKTRTSTTFLAEGAIDLDTFLCLLVAVLELLAAGRMVFVIVIMLH
jgi:hypothetical protein